MHHMGVTPDKVIATLQKEPYKNPDWWEDDERLEAQLDRPLGVEERLRLKELLYGQCARTRQPRKIGHLIEMWRHVVQSVAGDYCFDQYEYAASLGWRSELEGLVEQLPAPLKGDVRRVLDAIDSEFRSLTVVVEKPILPRPNTTLGWWEYRLPRKGATWL